MANNEEMFYRYRKRFNMLVRHGKSQTAEAASLFYYLNRTDFNGLCRFNRSGEFNVPFGQYKSIDYIRDLTPYSVTFSKWEFLSGDFQDIPLEPVDFVYADPPYDVQFTRYSKEAFGWDEQVRTAEWLAQHEGPVVLSNQATDRIVELYDRLGFDLFYLDAPRRINCTGDRTPAREVLALKLPKVAVRRSTVSKGPEMSIKEWLANNGYNDVVRKIGAVELNWERRGTKTRRNWGDVLAGHKDGTPKTIAGVKFPVLAAARKRKGWPATKSSVCRNHAEKMPAAEPQVRWEKCKSHARDQSSNHEA